MTGIGVVKPFKYPSMPPALILLEVIIMNTTTAQAASVERSAVGLLRPVRLIRLETTLVVNKAATNGIRLSNFVPPVLFLTNFCACSTSISAIACRLDIFSTFRSLVSQIHSPVISIITIQLTTSVSDIRKSPRTGMPVGILK